jgi:thymidine kinase
VVEELPEVDLLTGYDVIGVDEGHRFDNIAEWADALANKGLRVNISALDGDIKRDAYPPIIRLLPFCERVQKFDSVCELTGLPAPFSAIQNGIIVPISRMALLRTPGIERALGTT